VAIVGQKIITLKPQRNKEPKPMCHDDNIDIANFNLLTCVEKKTINVEVFKEYVATKYCNDDFQKDTNLLLRFIEILDGYFFWNCLVASKIYYNPVFNKNIYEVPLAMGETETDENLRFFIFSP